MKFFIIILFSLSVFAGERGGNGGGVHVCPDKVELYDFYETGHPLLHNIKMWKSDPNIPMNIYIERALAHVQKDLPEIYVRVKTQLDKLLAIPQDEIVLNLGIPLILDADISMVDEGCDYDQVANWNDRIDRLFFRKKYFDRMDSMNRAGLYFHETLYKLSRESFISNTSDSIREVVGKIFSDEKLSAEDQEKVWSENSLILRGGDRCTNTISNATGFLNLLVKVSNLCKTATTDKAEILNLRDQVLTNLQELSVSCLDRCYSTGQRDLCVSIKKVTDDSEKKICQ